MFLCGWYPSRVLTNNGDFIQRHAQAVATKHKVSVLHIITDKNCKKKIEISIDRKKGVTTYIAYVKQTKNRLIKGYRFYLAFKRLMKLIGEIDLVHLNEIYPFGIFIFLLNKPYIISEHWTGYHQPQAKNLAKIHLFLSKIITRNATFICPVSNNLKQALEFLGLKGNYQIVPNVVDTHIFHPITKSKKTVFTILHISNMIDEHKNVSGLISAVSELNFPYQLILIGENSNQYKSLTKSLGLSKNVTFINHIPHNEVSKYIQQADVFTLFSNYENLPCVILESFACGIPVISTNVGGISEFFPETFGYLIKKNKRHELVEKLTLLYQKPIKNELEMHNYAKQHFSYKNIATDFSKLYEKTVS
ncbi:glycosyltransferase involved in cell wall biosynthesis [Tenacibaculum adriaticum]|uniref:Glycosyltransferase involved in cell wall biosynthesis n=1 Tax=Tenacibaculum adriaticum TaxID=413713 RepID=A0A5S5DQK6_9FLAO|nr:glycosyltransferase involved in cell wall biosynthesis [Tenacibaculum adriaticum]